MTPRHRLVTGLVVLAWLGNGLFAKVLGFAPRHTEIVARVLGAEYAETAVVLIGLGEVALAAWIWLGYYPRATAALQIALVLAMNVLELLLARDLLLWGPLNFAFALAFCGLVYYHGFVLGGRLGAVATNAVRT